MSAVSCVCEAPAYGEVRSEGGGLLCLLCRRCMRPAQLECRVCKRRFKDIRAHLERSECGRFDREGLWWTTERPPTARQVFP